jgi:hypothetical protein
VYLPIVDVDVHSTQISSKHPEVHVDASYSIDAIAQLPGRLSRLTFRCAHTTQEKLFCTGCSVSVTSVDSVEVFEEVLKYAITMIMRERRSRHCVSRVQIAIVA